MPNFCSAISSPQMTPKPWRDRLHPRRLPLVALLILALLALMAALLLGGCGLTAEFKNMDTPEILSRIRQALKQKVESQTWSHLMDALMENDEAIRQLEMKTVKEWIPEVARFSYREWVG